MMLHTNKQTKTNGPMISNQQAFCLEGGVVIGLFSLHWHHFAAAIKVRSARSKHQVVAHG